MTRTTTRRRKNLVRGFGALGVSAALVAAAASGASASTVPADDGGSGLTPNTDLDALVAAATEEGQVNLIALPPDWANYAGILESFAEKFPGIDTPVQSPDASSADEITAVNTQRGSDTMPDVLDVSPPVALQAVVDGNIWDPYKPSTWDEIPENMRDADGNWVAAYYGIMAIGVNTTIITDDVPQSFEDLKNMPAGSVAINGDPREAGAAFAAVMAASLANGGSLDDITPGIEYFAELKAAGVLSSTAVTPQTVLSGETPIVLDWSYNFPGMIPQIEEAGFTYATAFPSDGIYGSYYAQGVVQEGPHPNAGRLWIEHILSDEGALGYLEGGAIPARYATLVENGVITEDMLGNLPPAELVEQVTFATPDQIAAAQEILLEQWGPQVADA